MNSKLLRILPSLYLVVIAISIRAQTVRDIEGNVYKTVTIGNQEWMAENLKTTKYNNGKQIELVDNQNEWLSFSTHDAYCWYNDNPNNKNLGALYNLWAITSGNLCPTGWHVPTRNDWDELVQYIEKDKGYRKTGSRKGGVTLHLKATDFADRIPREMLRDLEGKPKDRWPQNGKDDYGFRVIPSGNRSERRTGFSDFMTVYFWTSSRLLNNSAESIMISPFDHDVHFRIFNEKVGANVRCIKD